MSSKSKAKSKAKTPAKGPKPRLSLRTLWLEILFFVALAVFGFSVVARLIGGESTTVFHFSPLSQAEDPDVPTSRLYEAASRRVLPEPSLSPIFMPSVRHWKDHILKWASDYAIDPNLVATIMQIESCGDPQAGSRVGAIGLFQVMPFHFDKDEDPFDPDTNTRRGLDYLSTGLELSGGHAGLALAGYNGGHGIISRSYEDWPRETQSYYRWGSGIYREASAGWDSSPTLAAWLAAGGQSLCDAAEDTLDLASSGPGN
ncbi:MAG: lytic transglycosylase domain-containing protein [Anaerolineae bacterium]|nr:lytic transglycosylase domain-containing protein [Anaerolineae bacterium]